jgi:hypothetical protein
MMILLYILCDAGRNHDLKVRNTSFQKIAQSTFGNDNNKYKFDSGGNLPRVMLATIQSRTFCLLDCCLKTKNKTIVLPANLYGCETLLTLREEHD